MKEGFFTELPIEIRGEIFTRLPAKSLFGNHDVRWVCTAWFNHINKLGLKITKEQIINECNSKETSIALLSDKIFRGNLKYEEWLRVISFNDEAVNEIINCISEEEILLLCKHNPKQAMRLFKQPHLHKQFDKFRLAKDHIEVARALYSDQAEMEKIKPFHLFFLATHGELFQKISKSPDLMQLLGLYLLKLPKEHIEAARWIFNTYKDRPPDFPLLESIFMYEELCHAFLDDDDLSNQASGKMLKTLADKHVSVAKRIADSFKLSHKLDVEQKLELIHLHPSLLSYWQADLLQASHLFEGGYLGAIKVASFIRQNKKIFELIRGDQLFWQSLSRECQEEILEAARIFNWPDILESIDSGKRPQEIIDELVNSNFPIGLMAFVNIKKLLEKAKTGLDCALAILESSLSAGLSSNSLLHIALASKRCGFYILQKEDLTRKLDHKDICRLASHCIDYAFPAVSYSKMNEDIDFLLNLCQMYPQILKSIKNDSEFLKQLSKPGQVAFEKLFRQLEVIRCIKEASQQQEYALYPNRKPTKPS